MKVDSKTEQKKFWKVFDEKLIENGEPFSLLHEDLSGEPLYWGGINKDPKYFSKCYNYCLSVDFLTKERKLRINMFVRNDLPFFNLLEKNRHDIEAMVRVSLKWVSGTKNPNTRRILYEHDIEIGNTENYAETIDDILPVVMEMKAVCEKYGKYKFFDF